MRESIQYKTEAEIELQRESSLLVGKTLAEVAKILKPGVSTKALDEVAESYIRDNDALPGFKGYGGFPATLCISINDEVVHGIPGDRIVKDGDVVSIDCGTYKNGFYGDSAYTFAVGNVSEDVKLLLQRTKESLYLAIEQAIVGKRVGDIGYAVQNYCESFGYGIVRDLVGHGVGKNLHESPEVPNFGRRGTGPKLKEGMCIAIEPMVTLGRYDIQQDVDGWTIRTVDGLPAAHYEHDMAIKKGKADVLSTFSYIEEVLKNQQ
ncbi:MAG: type I methionyl aminopeptidase [Bacteroidales bacterium]|nr:type I methionyl aminopeptidase [Bacteroidales bacterium]